MTEGRFSIQMFYVLALTCSGKALQVVRRVPEGFGFEAWKQLGRELEPRHDSKECFNPNKSGRPGADNVSMGKQGDGLRGTAR